MEVLEDAIEHTKSHFEHAQRAQELITCLCDDETLEKMQAVKQLGVILDEYQEQSHLLDPYLEGFVQPVMANIRRDILKTLCIDALLPLFRFLYLLTKTRGYKTVVKFMSHDVSDLEPVYDFLSEMDASSFEQWEARYICFVWLSLICMIPFDLYKVDRGDTETPLVEKLLLLCKVYLKSTGKERDGASVLVARLLSRRDVSHDHLIPYITWCRQQLDANDDVFEATGILSSLCGIYQVTSRETLLPTLDEYLIPMLTSPLFDKYDNNAVIRKLRTKLNQRVGIAYLKPKIATWRYHRGNRSLRTNLGDAPDATVENLDPGLASQIHDDDYDISENVETIIDLLLNGLRDKDTIVRWSAAKGIGRITQRLPELLAQDVVTSLLGLFEENTFFDAKEHLDMTAVSDHTWHGVSLAIGELARRGLLLPQHLEQTIYWVNFAIKFDLKKGSHSIGAHVRDAACYVCWSFARAYAPEIMAPFVHKLAPSLITASVFDREVNVRRASSAAFQENVGRQGIFPMGIDIIQLADYFSVGNRNNTFLHVAVEIAKIQCYRYHMIGHLVQVTSKHWDKTMRVLASKALSRMVPLDPVYFIQNTIPAVTPLATVKDIQIAHGAILCLSEICLALYKCRQQDPSLEALWQANNVLQKSLAKIVQACPPKSLTTFGSEHIREAICQLVGNLAQTKLVVCDNVLESWKQVVQSSLERKEENVQRCAVDAFASVTQSYGINATEFGMYLKMVEVSHMMYSRRGYALALGTINYNQTNRHPWLHDVIHSLGLASKVQTDHHTNDAEAKRNAIFGLHEILMKVDDNTMVQGITEDDHMYIIATLENCLKDYSADQRGDVGSWVRTASMRCLGYYIPRIAQLWKTLTSPVLVTRIFAAIMKQSVERIDRVRQLGGSVLQSLLWTPNLTIAHVHELQKLIPTDLDFGSASDLYPVMVQILDFSEYRIELLTGLITSAGAITESLMRYASSSLMDYIRTLPVSNDGVNVSVEELMQTWAVVFMKYEKQDRVTLPLLDTLGQLYEFGIASTVCSPTIHHQLYSCVHKECFRTKNIKKLLSVIKVYVGFLALPSDIPTKTKSLQKLLSYLMHAYPRVRMEVADQLFGYMSLLGEKSNDLELLEAEEIITSTDWSLDISSIKPIRDRLYHLLDIPKPAITKKLL
ncbi:ARM repeat-containing protein [Hesseltinella vesiculosa]|uniref:ARM repeat-containing protein n=1 Tax=Hesseltinella vesiculosa TaxID=101127 RepID=A0A1X2GNB0_9FUNG|nr:ARM repeat-containing protein [Hesseltinella vesiculosa]